MLGACAPSQRAVSRPGRQRARTVQQAELRLSVFVRSGDMVNGHQLCREIVEQARNAGLTGATVVYGIQGFGHSATMRPPALLRRTGFEPVLVEIADDPARVHAFLPVLDRLLGSGLVVLKTVMVTRRAADLPDIAATASP